MCNARPFLHIAQEATVSQETIVIHLQMKCVVNHRRKLKVGEVTALVTFMQEAMYGIRGDFYQLSRSGQGRKKRVKRLCSH